MKFQRLITLFALLLAALPASARTELALIPKIGYMAPADSEQELNSVEFAFEDTAALALALDIRHLFGNSETPCGLAIGPEYLHYSYGSTYVFLGQEQKGNAETHALLVAPKLMCAIGNARYFLGVGAGFARNQVDIGDRQIENYAALVSQLTAGAELGGKTVRLHTELRYFDNSPSEDSARQYNGSGFGVFVGVSVILRNLPPPWKPWKPE